METAGQDMALPVPTLQGTKISRSKDTFEDDFPFPKGGICSQEGKSCIINTNAGYVLFSSSVFSFFGSWYAILCQRPASYFSRVVSKTFLP